MADDPKKRGKADQMRVSKQKHELRALKEKFNISGQAAGAAHRAAGPLRKNVEKHIKEMKKAGKY